MKNILSFSLFIILFISCKSGKDVAIEGKSRVLYSIDRGPCFGKCPVYNMKIYETGFATYEGRPFARKLGKYEKQMSKDDMKKLAKAFKSADFFNFREIYESEIVDLPMVKISHNDGKQSKTVEGREDRPSKLMELQFMLEKIAESEDWKLVEAYKTREDLDNEEKDQIIYSEIIIEPATGVRLPVWFKEKEGYGIKLKTKLSPEGNLWLITYDVSRFAPGEILDMLKSDPAILHAEFNKLIKNRSEE